MKFLRILFVTVVAVATLSAQQVIRLRDGTRHDGRVVRSDSRSVTFVDDHGQERTVDADEVLSIDYGRSSDRDTYADEDRRPSDRSYRTELPAGTEIAVRANDTIDAKSADTNRTYSAVIDQDVTTPNGDVVIPRGSEAALVVKRASGGGTVGTEELVLDLAWVQINGKRYRLDTSDLERRGNSGIGANRRTGEYVGGGAALGTLLGALGGGGKGAIIGAIAGAAAGGTVQVITRGHEVKVPAETVLKFRLDQAQRLYPLN